MFTFMQKTILTGLAGLALLFVPIAANYSNAPQVVYAQSATTNGCKSLTGSPNSAHNEAPVTWDFVASADNQANLDRDKLEFHYAVYDSSGELVPGTSTRKSTGSRRILFEDPGTYLVRVWVRYDGEYALDNVCQKGVTVNEAESSIQCMSVRASDNEGRVPFTTRFKVNIRQHNIDGPIEYEVNFGDGTGNVFSNNTFSHTYEKSGNFTVKVRAHGGNLASNTCITQVAVAPEPEPRPNPDAEDETDSTEEEPADNTNQNDSGTNQTNNNDTTDDQADNSDTSTDNNTTDEETDEQTNDADNPTSSADNDNTADQSTSNDDDTTQPSEKDEETIEELPNTGMGLAGFAGLGGLGGGLRLYLSSRRRLLDALLG